MSTDNAELVVGIFALALGVLVLWLVFLDNRVSELMAWRFERDAERLREHDRRH